MAGQSAKEAAQRAGISPSNFTRWKSGARADPEFVVKIARAYGSNVLHALVEAEFITEDEAELTEVSPIQDIRQFRPGELAAELNRQIQALDI